MYGRRLVLQEAGCVRRGHRAGQPDDLRVKVQPPQLEVVLVGAAVPPTQVRYLKGVLASSLMSTRRVQTID